MDNRIIVIGEAPVAGARLREQWLHPDFCASGRRLLDYSGWTREEYLGYLERRNLMPTPVDVGRWDADTAERLAALEAGSVPLGATVVLLGQRVAEAFDHLAAPLLTWQFLEGGPLTSRYVAVVPHPSGRNRWFNDPANRDAFRRFWRASLA